MKLNWLILFLTICFTICAKAQPAPPGGPPVVITEIMYHSLQSGVDNLEFIELRNTNPLNARNLAGYSFLSGVEYTFPPGVILQPNEYVLIAIDSIAFENTFGIQAYQWVSGSLDDAGETIKLRNNIGGVIDSVVYGNSSPWPMAPSGNGSTLTLCNDTLDNSLVANWSATTTNTGIIVNGVFIHATPGSPCSIDNSIQSDSKYFFKVFPNPSMGSFSLSTPAHFSKGIYQVYLTDMTGRKVWQTEAKLHAGETLKFNQQAAKGSYVLSIENAETDIYQQLLIVD